MQMKMVDRLLSSMAFGVIFIGTMGTLGTVGKASGSPPTILGDPGAFSMHWLSEAPYVDENGISRPQQEDYGISFSVAAQDDHGSDNILSVIVTDLKGNEYILNDEGLLGDLQAHDGVYQFQRRGLTGPPNISTYVFTVTNKQGEFISKVDYINRSCDVAKVLLPDNKQIVTQPNPTFSWEPVDGATVYTVTVRNWANTPLWQVDVNGTSVTYNGSSSLTDGNFYWWDISTFDDENNFSHHYNLNFAYSSDTAKPVIGMPLVMTGNNYDDGTHTQVYSCGFFALVADPQGLYNVKAVEVHGPTGDLYELNDAATDGDLISDDGFYQLWEHGLSNRPEPGTYNFTVSDVDGHSEVMAQQATCRILYEPGAVSPKAGEVTGDAAPTFQWERVLDATSYRIVVSDSGNRELWSQNLQDNSPMPNVVYNNDNTGTPLIHGREYKWQITAYDAYYNSSTRHNISFQYSTDDGADGGGGGGGGCFILTSSKI